MNTTTNYAVLVLLACSIAYNIHAMDTGATYYDGNKKRAAADCAAIVQRHIEPLDDAYLWRGLNDPAVSLLECLNTADTADAMTKAQDIVADWDTDQKVEAFSSILGKSSKERWPLISKALVILTLLEVDPDSRKMDDQKTAAHKAVECADKDVTLFLLKSHAQTSYPTRAHMLPLFAGAPNSTIAYMLLKRGADTTIPASLSWFTYGTRYADPKTDADLFEPYQQAGFKPTLADLQALTDMREAYESAGKSEVFLAKAEYMLHAIGASEDVSAHITDLCKADVPNKTLQKILAIHKAIETVVDKRKETISMFECEGDEKGWFLIEFE